MIENNTVNAKLSNSQLNKLKSAVKNNQGTTLRMNARMLSANNLTHELLLNHALRTQAQLQSSANLPYLL